MVCFIWCILLMMFVCEIEESMLLCAGRGRRVFAECVLFQFLEIEPSGEIARGLKERERNF